MQDEVFCLLASTSRQLLDTPAEERFDRLTRLARRCFTVPLSLLTVLTPERQWFKSAQGTEQSQSPVEVSFCVHALRAGRPLVLPDLAGDPRFSSSPLVAGPPHLRFYAGVPVCGSEGRPVGTLCILDTQPRPSFGAVDLACLQDLAACAESELRQSRWSEAEQQLLDEAGERRCELIDPETRSWSRRAILNIAFSETVRSQLHQRPLTCVIIHNPSVQPTLTTAELLRRQLAPSQSLGRLGPQSFLMVLPEVSPAQAQVLLSQLEAQGLKRLECFQPDPACSSPEQLIPSPGDALGASRASPTRAYSFGPFELHVQGESVSSSRFRSQKTRLLLAYLLGAPGKRASEEVLLDEFWPQGGESGRNSLRASLSTLRTLLRPQGSNLDPLRRENGFVTVSQELDLESDLDRFLQLRECLEHERSLAEAAALHRGPYLEGTYADWALLRRDQFLQSLVALNLRRAQLAFSRADFESAAEAAEQGLAWAPERQDLLGLLFRCWLRQGCPEQVVRRFRQSQAPMAEFGVEPSIELLELVHRAELGLSD